MTKKELLIASVHQLAIDVLYYDRKNDEELSADDVEQLINSGQVELRELVSEFHFAILEYFPDIQR